MFAPLGLPAHLVLADQDPDREKIASRETIIVSRLNGKGSKGFTWLANPPLMTIQPANQMTWTMAKVAVPAARVTTPAMRSVTERARICAASSRAI